MLVGVSMPALVRWSSGRAECRRPACAAAPRMTLVGPGGAGVVVSSYESCTVCAITAAVPAEAGKTTVPRASSVLATLVGRARMAGSTSVKDQVKVPPPPPPADAAAPLDTGRSAGPYICSDVTRRRIPPRRATRRQRHANAGPDTPGAATRRCATRGAERRHPYPPGAARDL